MNHFKTLLLTFTCVLGCTRMAVAQDTNALRTQIGVMEARTGSVIVKGIGQLGSLPLGVAELDVKYKETVDAGGNQKVYGLAIDLEGGNFPRSRVLVDDDELDALIDGVNYLAKIRNDVTTLPALEATYTTKAGLTIIADAIRREGAIVYYVQTCDSPRIGIAPVQMTQLANLLQQGRKNLDALKAGK